MNEYVYSKHDGMIIITKYHNNNISTWNWVSGEIFLHVLFMAGSFIQVNIFIAIIIVHTRIILLFLH